jgi:hypothetical protein
LSAESFSCSLDFLYEDLGIYIYKFQLYFFLQFLVINTMDLDPDSLEMLDPDSMNPDAQL